MRYGPMLRDLGPLSDDNPSKSDFITGALQILCKMGFDRARFYEKVSDYRSEPGPIWNSRS